MANIRKITRASGDRYEARIHRAGVKPMSKSFTTLAAARQWSNAIEAKIDKGEKVSRKPETVKFTEACDDFLAYWRPRKGDEIPEQKRLLIGAIRHDDQLSQFTIAQLTHEVIQNYIDNKLKTKVSEPAGKKKVHPLYKGATRKTYASGTVRKHYYAIKQVLEWHSIREKYMLDGNLFKNHNVPGPWEGARKRRLEEGELDKLKEAAQRGYEHRNEWPLLIEFAIATAARSQEILKAEWKEVNIAGRAWNIPEEHVKTSTFRQIPLSKKAIDILHKMADMKSATSPRIFHMWKDSSTISKGFRRLTARAGVENLRFHDLRHEATSLLFEKTTMSDIEIMQMTGHTNIATLEGYAHLRASYVADKLDAIK